MKIQFSIRDLLLMTVIIAVSVGWWLDHRVLVNRYEVPNKGRQSVMVYPIKTADANVVIKVLQTTLAGESVSFSMDSKCNSIVALGNDSQQKMIHELINKMDGK